MPRQTKHSRRKLLTDTEIADAKSAAQTQIKNRESRDALAGHYQAIEQAIDSLFDIRGAVSFEVIDGQEVPTSRHAGLLLELVRERDRTSLELAFYRDSAPGSHECRECAPKGELLREGIRQILIARGANPYQIAALEENKICASGELSDSASRKRAQRIKVRQLQNLRRQREETSAALEKEREKLRAMVRQTGKFRLRDAKGRDWNIGKKEEEILRLSEAIALLTTSNVRKG